MNRDFFLIVDASKTPIAAEYIEQQLSIALSSGYVHIADRDLIWLVVFNVDTTRDFLRIAKAAGYFCLQLESTIFVKVSIEEVAYLLVDSRICQSSKIPTTMTFPDFNVLLYDDDDDVSDFISLDDEGEDEDDNDDD